MSYPIIDLHCDLPMYLAFQEQASLEDTEGIGAALPHLLHGKVAMQTMAFFSPTGPGSPQRTLKQAEVYNQLPEMGPFSRYEDAKEFGKEGQVLMYPAIENASGLCDEEEDVSKAWERLEQIQQRCGKLLYIIMTHHTENRFGGGNYSEGVGLKADGMALLDRMDGTGIAIDLSHTSDLLAEGILNYTSQKNLKVPILASHSNFRPIWSHVRNLPDEFAQEIANRNGIIGINLLRAYVDDDNPERLMDHIFYGWEKFGDDTLAWGADYFYTLTHPDPSRHPMFHKEHENASKYPGLMEQLREKGATEKQLKKLAFENTKRWISEIDAAN